MSLQRKRAFTLLELIVVVLVSSGMTLVVALFLQRGIAVYTRTTDESQLVGQVRLMLERLRKCARHSVSAFCNWRNATAANRPFDATETLFFLTDFDQDGDREAHFVWFDRCYPLTNTRGSNKVVHCWKRVGDPTWGGLNLAQMPPDMTAVSPTFTSFLGHLQDPKNFRDLNVAAAGAQKGWEALLESIPITSSSSLSDLPICLGRWVSPSVGSGWGATPSTGIAFNIENVITVQPTAVITPTWGYPAVSPAVSDSLLFRLSAPTAPYPRPVTATIPPPFYSGILSVSFGSPHCQLYVNVFVDRNANFVRDPDEAGTELVTSLNMLLIPSAGLTDP